MMHKNASCAKHALQLQNMPGQLQQQFQGVPARGCAMPRNANEPFIAGWGR